MKISKGVIRIRKLRKDRKRNGQKKMDKGTNNELQNIYIKLTIETIRKLTNSTTNIHIKWSTLTICPHNAGSKVIPENRHVH